jgi:hypothetical protein
VQAAEFADQRRRRDGDDHDFAAALRLSIWRRAGEWTGAAYWAAGHGITMHRATHSAAPVERNGGLQLAGRRTRSLANSSQTIPAACRMKDGDSSDWIEIYNPDHSP